MNKPSRSAKPVARRLLRDQQRACLAYTKVAQIDDSLRDEYRICIRSFAANLRRMGLAAASSQLERDGRAGERLLEHLAAADIVGLGTDPKLLPERARGLDDVTAYMLATRELLRLAGWLIRAVQATFPERDHAK